MCSQCTDFLSSFFVFSEIQLFVFALCADTGREANKQK
jgi:hypothetical protein